MKLYLEVYRMASTTIVTVEHSMATNGFLVPISDLELKRTFVGDFVAKEEYYYRGHVYARFYNWTGNIINNNFSEDYVIPSNAVDWNHPVNKPKKVDDYPFDEFYPWQSLKFVSFNVLYSKWKDDDYVVGNNEWAE